VSYLEVSTKFKVLLVPVVLIILVAAAWSTPSSSITPSRYSTNDPASSAQSLNVSGMGVNSVPSAGSTNADYGQSVGSSAQGESSSGVQGSVPPSSHITNPVTSSPAQPAPAEPDVLYPYDPPPFKCLYPTNTIIACPYCGSSYLKYPCGGCGPYESGIKPLIACANPL
jgi:hypothetical protein